VPLGQRLLKAGWVKEFPWACWWALFKLRLGIRFALHLKSLRCQCGRTEAYCFREEWTKIPWRCNCELQHQAKRSERTKSSWNVRLGISELQNLVWSPVWRLRQVLGALTQDTDTWNESNIHWFFNATVWLKMVMLCTGFSNDYVQRGGVPSSIICSEEPGFRLPGY